MANKAKLYYARLYCNSNDFRKDMTMAQIKNYIKEINGYDTLPVTSCLYSIGLDFQETKHTEVLVYMPENSPKYKSELDETYFRVYMILRGGCKCNPHNCLKNLHNGKCKDDFVRKIIGTKFFEDKYKEKQK